MSKIEELIEKYCPDGVEYLDLMKIAKTITTGKLNANAMSEDGIYPFFTCDAKPFKIDKYAFDMEAILISGNGSQVGHINYYKGKFNAYQRTYVLGDFIDKINIRFLFHYLLGYLKPYILNNCKKGSVPYITLPMLQYFKIPVPPLAVQEEIVRILDNFTELTAELTAELTSRKQQYEFYRDKLLTFDTIKFDTLKIADIADIYLGLTYTPTYVENGVKFLSSQNISNDRLDFNNVKYISQEEFDKSTSNAKPKRGDILFTRVGSNLGHPTIVETDEPFCIFVSLGYLSVKKGVSNRFVKHWINTDKFWRQVRAKTQNIPKANLNTGWLREFEIDIPSLEIQEKIADVLDNFDKICSDLSVGLPAEIEARQKQYEYYRNKLLSFKEKKV